MPELFISYSRNNVNFVERLYQALRAAGRTADDIWVDFEDIPYSADWWYEIEAGIDSAHTVISVISPDMLGSPVCNLEIRYARLNEKRIVPIVLQDVDDAEGVFAQLASKPLNDLLNQIVADEDVVEIARVNWQTLGHLNWLFFRETDNFDGTFEALLETIDADLDYLRHHARLLTRAREWDGKGRDDNLLLRGIELEEAQDWLSASQEREPSPTDLQVLFITASSRAENERREIELEQQRRLLELGQKARTRLLILVGGLGVFLVVAVFLAILAFQSSQEAQLRTSQVLASYAREANRNNQISAIALAVAAANRVENPPPQVVQTLRDIATAPGPVDQIKGYGDVIWSVAYTGSEALSGSGDGSVSLWNPQTHQLLWTTQAHQRVVRSVAFSPDGRKAVSGSEDRTIVLWDAETGDLLKTLVGHTSAVTSVAFSPDGTKLLSGGADRTLRMWDLESGAATILPPGHSETVLSVAFSPDGKQALSGGSDNRLILWDLESFSIIEEFTDHKDWVWSVAFSPDGTLAASASDDDRILLWNLADRSLERTFVGHTNILSVAFSPDGQRLISSYQDGSLNVWSISQSTPLFRLNGHEDTVRSVAFSPDGQWVLSGSDDRSLIIWDVVLSDEGTVSDTLEQLLSWTSERRLVRALTCEEREQIGIDDASCR